MAVITRDNPDEFKVMQALLAIWNYIGDDCLKCAADEMSREKGRRVRKGEVMMSREEVIELVLDAGRFEQQDREAADYFNNLSDAEQRALLLKIFQYERYGF